MGMRACAGGAEVGERWVGFDGEVEQESCVTQKLRVGVLGAGVFGTYHARKAHGSALAELVGVFDADGARADKLAEETGARRFERLDDMLAACDAVMIATPARTHFELVERGIEAGRHVLVEKPLALTAEKAGSLVNQAESDGLVLQVGHQERLVCRTLGLFDAPMPIERIELVRCGPPPKGGRAMDVSVIWDLMIHDIDLVSCLLGAEAHGARASGICELGTEFDAVEAAFEIGRTRVSLKASRISDTVERRMRLFLSDGEIDVDFVGRSVRNTSRFALNDGFATDLPDPLGAADEAFFAACLGQAETPVSGRSAAIAVATAEKLETRALSNTGAK